jgi:hypothetical protein
MSMLVLGIPVLVVAAPHLLRSPAWPSGPMEVLRRLMLAAVRLSRVAWAVEEELLLLLHRLGGIQFDGAMG